MDNSYELGGWVLSGKEVWDGDILKTIKDLYWFIPEVKVESHQKNSQEYPYYWIQIHKNLPATTPFDIKSKEFKKAFIKSYKEFTNKELDTLEKDNSLSRELLNLIFERIS